jgi:DnaJ homolog subfamily C member 2
VPPPTRKQLQKGNFFKLWSPVFESEARFSKVDPVPQLGGENSTKAEVEKFYDFWYNFDSWRSFEYQDEDVPDDNENRDQKRHIERKNNNARRKKKTEDTARLRSLVDDCLASDERIKRFRTEERAGKNKKRLEKEAAEKRAREEAERARAEAERLQREREEAERAEKAEGKKAKEAAKNAVKKNKRVLKASLKDANYFVDGGADASPQQVDAALDDVDLLTSRLDGDELAGLAARLAGRKGGEIRGVWQEEVRRLVAAGRVKDGEVKTMG